MMGTRLVRILSALENPEITLSLFLKARPVPMPLDASDVRGNNTWLQSTDLTVGSVGTVDDTELLTGMSGIVRVARQV